MICSAVQGFNGQKKGQLSSWPRGDWSIKIDVTSRNILASATAYYLQNRVPEPCHQERAEARPVLNKNRLGEGWGTFVTFL